MPRVVNGGVIEPRGNRNRQFRIGVVQINFAQLGPQVAEIPVGAVGTVTLADVARFPIAIGTILDYSDGNRHNDRSMQVLRVDGPMRIVIQMQ